MCGRFVRKGEPKKLAQNLGVVAGEDNWTESYNVAPGSTIPIIRANPAGRHMVPATWGFISSGRAPLFNARGETIDSLPSFRDAFRVNRCLIPASGFYEWRPSDRQSFYFEMANGQPLTFAGIWKQVGSLLQATVITTNPKADMGGIHDRMPVILSPDTWSNWLSSTPLSDSLRRSLLTPSPDGTLSRWPVGRGVGSIRNDYPSLLDPVEPPAIPQELF
jgi:putative SOS response-associated peptidase YedK